MLYSCMVKQQDQRTECALCMLLWFEEETKLSNNDATLLHTGGKKQQA